MSSLLTTEQNKIKIVAEAQTQSKLLEEALDDRREMLKKLLEQEEMLIAEQENRTMIMKALVVQGEHMAETKIIL